MEANKKVQTQQYKCNVVNFKSSRATHVKSANDNIFAKFFVNYAYIYIHTRHCSRYNHKSRYIHFHQEQARIFS